MCNCDPNSTPRERAAITFLAAMLSNSCGDGPPVSTRRSVQQYATTAVVATDALYGALGRTLQSQSV